MTARRDASLDAFLDPLDQVIQAPAPLALRLWPLLAGLLLAALLTAAAVLQVDVIVTASGRLSADVPSVVLRPAAAAVLRDLYVRPGDVVAAGDLVAALDPTLPAADLAAARAQAAALTARIARLQAELSGADLIAITPETAIEAQILAERRALAVVQHDALTAQIATTTTLIAAATQDASGLAAQLAVVRDVEAMRVTLAERQSGTQLAVLDARLVRMRAESDHRRTLTQIVELTQRRDIALAQLAAFDGDLRRQTSEALAEAQPRLAVLVEQIAKAQAVLAMADLRAPGPGMVLRVAEGGPGSLLAAGEAVVVLIPIDTPLVAEIALRSADAGRVLAGNAVTLKIDAFPWRRHGLIDGRLSDIGHASFTPEGGAEALHPAHVAFVGTLHDLPAGAALLPGMTLAAEIHLGTRSILSFFLDPVLRGLAEALREP